MLEPLTWALAALLAVLTCVSLGQGMVLAWRSGSDIDLASRANEYAWFRAGHYPNPSIAPATVQPRPPYSVYPPYAFPMLALFFEPGGLLQGRVVVELLSLVAIVALAAFGQRAVPRAATLAALAGPAIAGNGSAVALGQFSIICVGLLISQVLLLQRGKTVAAGCCWALAMLKPQIALAFAALFVVRRQWVGLLVGGAMLVALSALACWWTGVAPSGLADHWLMRSSLSFAADQKVSGPAQVASWLKTDGRVVQWSAVALLVGMSGGLGLALRRLPRPPDMLDLAGICGVLGAVLVYHRHYDNVMLLFTLLACLRRAVSRPSLAWTVALFAMGFSLWIPQRLFEQLPAQQFLRPVIWSVVAAMLLVSIVRTRDVPSDAPAPVEPG